LRHAFSAYQRGETAIPDWAKNFDAAVAKATGDHDGASLANLVKTADGRLSHPSPDHYYPLLYAQGASDKKDKVSFPIDGFDMSSLSMRSVIWG
jgi:4,5-DOPA dioxygenase extradiol